MEFIIFTDLDGSLLNHDDYSFDAARPILAEITNNAIPLIFVTSKTRGEVEILRQETGILEPFVVENGGGIFFPAGYRGFEVQEGRPVAGYTVVELGIPYAQVREFLRCAGSRFAIRGFGDLSVQEIALLTDLPVDKAALAQQREFTEPFVAGPGSDLQGFAEEAAQHGLKITRGGRFHHLLGAGQDKGAAVRLCRKIFSRNTGRAPLAAGIGDSENDLPMLSVVDIPVLIPRPDGSFPDFSLPGLVKAEFPGCRGWAETVGRILHGGA